VVATILSIDGGNKMQGSTEIAVASIRRPVGRTRINAPDEKLTARFRAGTMGRIKAALHDKEPQSEFIRLAVEAELTRREK
jgi:hypothetical protein